jgi:transcriptional regulator GlxA family with amidase domain
LTKIANMSERSLSRTFKKATGLTPIDYYIHLKVSHSCSLLQNTALSVSEIAYASGFSDSNYYTRQFKKIMGTSPTLYRNLNLLPHKLYH